MERPRSQLENIRPPGSKASRLPASTTSTARILAETTRSDLNSKTARDGSMLPPPSVKHKITGLAEPAPKRKTLVERAGEPLNRSLLPQVRSEHRNGYNAHHRGPSNSSTSSIGRPASAQSMYQNGPRGLRHQNAHMVASGQLIETDGEENTGTRKGIFTPLLDSSYITMRKTRSRDYHYKNRLSFWRDRLQQPRSMSDSPLYNRSVEAYVGEYGKDIVSLAKAQEAVDTDGTPISTRHTMRNISLSSAFRGLTITEKQEPETMRGSNAQNGAQCEEKSTSPTKLPRSNRHLYRPASSQPLPATPLESKRRNIFSTSISSKTATSRKFELPIYLTKEKLTPVAAWDQKGRLDDLDKMFTTLQKQMSSSADGADAMKQTIEVHKNRADELSQANRELSSELRITTSDLERARLDLHMTSSDLQQAQRDHHRDQVDLERQHSLAIDQIESRHREQMQTVAREGEQAIEMLEAEVRETKSSWEKQKDEELAQLSSEHFQEIDMVRAKHEALVAQLNAELANLRKSDVDRAAESASQAQGLKDTISTLQAHIEALNTASQSLRQQIGASESRISMLEQEKTNLISKAHFLEGNQEAQSQEFSDMTHRLQVAEARAAEVSEQLRKEETIRRRLNAQVLELKGNIRVFARLRPVLDGEEDAIKVDYPDAADLDGKKEVLFHAPTTKTATGKERNDKYNHIFDRVFPADASNANVFEECQDLVQSVIDGYNVSILSYGQTGSGKTFGMSGPDGIIPCSITLLLSEIARLREKGWEYTVEANFVEVYNETLNDLLGDAKAWDKDDDSVASTRSRNKARHEIHHDAVSGKTHVSNLTNVTLWPAPSDEASWPPAADVPASAYETSQQYTRQAVDRLLDLATKNRRVAATKANERSSRSHSVFSLTLKGNCGLNGESSEGILNLVDLAGSERLKHSGAEGSRAKETAAINTSLKSLGDVIEKVGSGSHVPYRNSKLTYLLQSSLGGNTANGKSSRTLLMLHLSPLQAHWQETKTSLQFGVKVHGTHIGTAKKSRAG